MSNVLKKLESLGFGAYEAKAYYALLRKYPANGYEVSKLAEIPPSKVYEALARLKNRGAVLDSQSEPVQYYPVQPDILFARIKAETDRNIESALADLTNLPPLETFELTWNLKGTAGITAKIIELLEQAQEEVFASLWPEQLPAVEQHLAAAVQRGVYVVAAIFGECTVSASTVINLEACSRNIYRRAGAKLCTVIADSRQVVIGELAEQDRQSTGVWTRTPSLVLVAKEYVRHDMMVNLLVQSMGTAEYDRICGQYAMIGRLQQER